MSPLLSIGSRSSVHSLVVLYWVLSLLAPNLVEARDCVFYIDSLGRRRRRCYGLLPGIIAALIVGILVILAFLSLAFVLQRRRQRATLGRTHTLSPTAQDNNSMIQPPVYPPPSYPMSGSPNAPIILPPQVYGEEKFDNGVHQDPPQASNPAPIQAPIVSHHPQNS